MPRPGPVAARPSRRLAFVVVSFVAVASLVGYLAVERQDRVAAEQAAVDKEAATTRLSAARVADVAHLVVRNTEAGPSYGRLALLPLDDLDGPRAILPMSCERISVSATGGICLTTADGPVTDHRALLLDGDLSARTDLGLGGLPSRARISAEGGYAASTVFVTGHAYTDAGFSTETLIYDLGAREAAANIESWPTFRDGQQVTAADRNYWGVTFVGDGPRFYATMGTAGTTFLVEGDLQSQRMTVLRENAACPSVSPDGTRVVYKQHDEATGDNPLVMLDLRTGVIVPLGETRPVDDQVSWLDDETVVYAVGQGSSSFVNFDLWSASVVEGGRPRLLVSDAASPSVVALP